MPASPSRALRSSSPLAVCPSAPCFRTGGERVRPVRELTACGIACGDRRRVASGQARVASALANLQALSEAQRVLFDMLDCRSTAEQLTRAEIMREFETIAAGCLKEECPSTLVSRLLVPGMEIVEGTIPPGAVDPDRLKAALSSHGAVI